MKFLIIAALIALAVASPIDDKTPQNQKSSSTNDQKSPIPLNKAPLSPSPVDTTHPLNKRDTPKTETVSTVNAQKPQPALASNVQKNDAKKPADANRKTREATTTAAPTTASSYKHRRDLPKAEDVKKQPVDQKATPSVSNAPQNARVPLTSTNSRSRRDTQKAVDQTVSSPVSSVKAENTPTKNNQAPAPGATNQKPKRDTPTETAQPQSNYNQGSTTYRRPAPVDQVLKQKAATTESPKISDDDQ